MADMDDCYKIDHCNIMDSQLMDHCLPRWSRARQALDDFGANRRLGNFTCLNTH